MVNGRSVTDYSYDGIIVLKKNGRIQEINEAACRILGTDSSFVGKRYIDLMEENENRENDAFHQSILDTLKNDVVKVEQACYHRRDGSASYLSITAVKTPGEGEDGELYLVFKDITRQEEERRGKERATYSMLVMLIFCGVWNFSSEIWKTYGQSISQDTISQLMVVFAGIAAFFVAKYNGFRLKHMGLSFHNQKRNLLVNSLIALALLAGMAGLKWIILKVNPNYPFYTDGSFFMLSKYPVKELVPYVFSVIGQEIITRSVLQEALARIIPNDAHEIKAILLSSFLFGALHIHVGLTYMLGAAIMLCIFGFVYREQRSVWSLCIVHFVLGCALGWFGFVRY